MSFVMYIIFNNDPNLLQQHRTHALKTFKSLTIMATILYS